jgi:hypothetical protein
MTAYQRSNGELGGYLGDKFPSNYDCLGVRYSVFSVN